MKINTEIFNARDLIKCYAPPNLDEVMVGNRVMLRSGGPEMVVMGVKDKDSVMCWYEGPEGIEKKHFDRRMLTCFGAK